MTTALNRHLLAAPHGTPGSARARYGAAMALYAEGTISYAQLEAYREASAFDTQDPAQVLSDRGLAPPVLEPLSPDALLHLLLAEADRLLAATPGEGVAEVRHGLAPAFAQAPQPVETTKNAVLETYLAPALVAAAETDPTLASTIAAAAPLLHWITYDAYDPARIGPRFPQSHAFAALVGEAKAPFAARDYDFGLFLVAPRTLYRDHAHAAPELYVPLTGPHLWRFAPGAALSPKPARAPVWNPPHRPHATLTGDVPFLALYGWTRDIHQPAYVLPAGDWAALEHA
jgi:hypothetical protein